MKKYFWAFFALALRVGNPPLIICLRSAGASMRKLIVCHAVLTLVGCSTNGWIQVPTYQHYYFYEPHVADAPASALNVTRDGKTIDLAFEGSENILSITTLSSRGDQGLILGSQNYTGTLALDALNERRIPMRLWVAASCRTDDWVMLPSKVRLVDPARPSSEIPLTVYLQPMPAVLHPDSQVFTAHWGYAPLDSTQEIRCQKGGTIAFTAGFEMTLTLTSLKIVFADSLQGGGKVLHIPDVELLLTGGEAYKSTQRLNILEMLLRAVPARI